MKNNWLSARRILGETLKEWREDNATNVAAALAYYAIFSLSPLLIVVALVLGFVIGSEDAQGQVIEGLQSMFGSQGADTLEAAIEGQEANPSAGLISGALWFAVVFWGVSGLFAQLQKALNIIWEVRLQPGASPLIIVKNRLLSFSVVMVASALIVMSTIINTALANVDMGSPFVLRPIQFVISISVITLLFAAVFKILPDVIIAWRDVWVGALFTALLFMLGQVIVGLYISNTNVGSVYGAAGSLTIILVWIYYSAQIFLFGAEFTEVWARYHGAHIEPDEDAEWINPDQAARERRHAKQFKEQLENGLVGE
ncbi:MAG: YihY/virulence factor BrkB family protein [Chloroflexi bacterium]|nr:YihY/virulence factor BrkB family protein [Chloroflexota bacterium]